MKSHKDLIVWQKSMDHVAAIYVATKAFPNEELFGIVSQMRRAAVSIPDKETVKFLSNALGSASELETQLIISKDLGYLLIEDFQKLINQIEEIIRMLSALIKSAN